MHERGLWRAGKQSKTRTRGTVPAAQGESCHLEQKGTAFGLCTSSLCLWRPPGTPKGTLVAALLGTQACVAVTHGAQ